MNTRWRTEITNRSSSQTVTALPAAFRAVWPPVSRFPTCRQHRLPQGYRL